VNLSWVDWAIVAAAVISLRFVSLSTRTHCKGVADFLSANRLAGRYLLTIAGGMGNMGVITFVALFEVYYQVGLPPSWWGFMGIPVGVIILLTGYVYWRFRETRALTMAQFFEMRYSRRFRIFAGIICWVSGLLNFGIFPAVAARFLIYFCGLPDTFQIPHLPIHFSTFATVMALDLGLALLFVNMGGQISVMVTECVQGIFSNVAFLAIVGCVLMMIPWPHIVQALSSAPADASMLHPYHSGQAKDFNIWYYLIGIVGSFYSYMSWQGGQGFYSSARSPHEQQMGGIIGIWRAFPQGLICILLPLAALVVFKLSNLPEYAAPAAAAHAALNAIPNEYVRSQMVVPVTMGKILPIGIRGLLATTMLFFSFTCHDTYMHSWGSIFIQDVVMPFRRRPLSPTQHIRLLRWSIAFVALFGFAFSLLYPQTRQILMFFAVTGTIWLGGSGAMIVGGLYWKRATTEAAYSAVIVGAVLGVLGLFADYIWQHFFHHDFPINGQWLWFIAMVCSLVAYVLVSFITGRKHKDANLEKMLHRGRYALPTDEPVAKRHSSAWLRILGITEHFTLSDKILAIALIMWNAGWFAAFLVITAIHFTIGTTDEWWTKFWHFYILLQFVIGIPATVWFTVGGIHDIKALFKTLEEVVRDPTDDGSVRHGPEAEPLVPTANVAGSGGDILKPAFGEAGVEQKQ
jgi:SSS family solute:Na+ symporter